MRALAFTLVAMVAGAVACSSKSAPTPKSFFADHFASYWIPCSQGEPCALPEEKRAGLSPALLERVLAVGAAYPDRAAVTAASAALDDALATAGVPVLIDVQPWQDTTLLLAYELVAKHVWRHGDKALPVVRVHRLDHTNIEPAWLGHAGREAPLVLLDKLEVELLDNLRNQRATDGNVVDAAVRKSWRALAEAATDAATLKTAIDALAQRDELHKKLEDSFQSKRVRVPYPERLLLGEDYFERLSPYADPQRSGGPLFMRTDLKALRAADRALGEGIVLQALHKLRDLEAGATEAHEVHHAVHGKLDPSSVPADVMEALGDDDLQFGVSTDGELRAYLGELHDAEAPPCLALGRLARILAGARAPRTPHHYAARVAFKHLHGGQWLTSSAAVAGAVEQLCALDDAALRKKAADAWTAIYREPMPVVRRAP